MAKKIAVLVRERQAEALRMSGGLTLLDDEVHVYILDRKLEKNTVIDKHLDMVRNMLELPIWTNFKDNDNLFDYISDEDLSNKLLDYEIVIPY